MWIPYFISALIFGTIAVTRVGRPMSKLWCAFLTVPYFTVALALVIRLYHPHNVGSWPVCLTMAGYAFYALLYAPVLYYIIRRDSWYVLQQMLEAERRPLLGFTHDKAGINSTGRGGGGDGGGVGGGGKTTKKAAAAAAAASTTSAERSDVNVRIIDGSETHPKR